MSSISTKSDNLFQIFISDGQSSLPPSLLSCQEDFIDQFSNYNYHFFNKLYLRQFIVEHFCKDVVAAYDTLLPYAYKADLGRYCLLYAFGGWYADITLKPVMTAKVPLLSSPEIIYFYDYGNGPYHSLYHCQNGFLYIKRGHRLMAECIEKILINCREKYIGCTPLAPTGPGLLGEKLIHHLGEQVHHGFFMQLTPFHKYKNRAYVGPSGHLMALHKSTWNRNASEGSLEAFGTSGVNNYIAMWSRKEIYAV
ncbi:glycosyltransferase [Synechococcus sp. KORDI-100]|uniref:glycosyltransferase n=1 Tax=Synechococcus sp. KORDI-100 TaxID=1280380 RepID=UPI0012E05776|nr:glycosyltransferase [Synechococcus sp. KORDI-100]